MNISWILSQFSGPLVCVILTTMHNRRGVEMGNQDHNFVSEMQDSTFARMIGKLETNKNNGR